MEGLERVRLEKKLEQAEARVAALEEALKAVTNDLVSKLVEQGYAMPIILEDWAVKKARAALARPTPTHGIPTLEKHVAGPIGAPPAKVNPTPGEE